MPPDATATKARLLAAATEEFARFGIAGARIDRIAAAARANKRLIYLHFGNKEQLFQIVVERCLGDIVDAVVFTVDDLPGYAGALLDHLVTHPQLLRLSAWKQLEAPEPTPAEIDAYRPKLQALADAQRRGRLRADVAPADVLAIVVALASAWPTSSPALWALAGEDPWSPERLARHRAAVVGTVRAMLAPESD